MFLSDCLHCFYKIHCFIKLFTPNVTFIGLVGDIFGDILLKVSIFSYFPNKAPNLINLLLFNLLVKFMFLGPVYHVKQLLNFIRKFTGVNGV